MRFVIVLILSFMMLTFSVSAEYYRYVDEDGVTRYTDDLSQIPKKNRDLLERFNELKDTSVTPLKSIMSQMVKNATFKGDKSETDELKKRKVELDKSFQSLREEKENFIAQQKELTGKKDSVEELNNKAVDLNKRIAEYEKEKKKYIQSVKAYNKQFENRD